MTGQKFGMLTVKEMLYGESLRSGKRITKCLCVCDCGNEKVVSADYLHNSSTPSCGCFAKRSRINKNRKDLTGLKFNRLTVIKMLWDCKPTKCVCECDCGNKCVVINTQLTSGKTQSCGCLHKEKTSSCNTKDFKNVESKNGVKIISRYKQNDNGVWIWKCICPLCNGEFYGIPVKILTGHTTSCGCRTKSSKERLIKGLLEKYNLNYIQQYSFDDCKYKYKLHFDFAIFNKDESINCLIEYDGKQHFYPIDFFGGDDSYNKTCIRDTIKNNYCKENDIRLIRLPYTLSDEEIKEKILNIINP